ncbi:uncharacterized protein KQ657_002215 [Scheffersomyces spartinae]|uniref:Gag1-like clamp domain-containing protein n=1 Tax=Scheffersomyces spartinae TaxID=45513 RepID=A0A9P7VDI0_9ASCO|nr:uncharacterized protein KQ657_002215 [Scheffersomyces spartinae]KAG7195830.1 hypothetical protein KQ657_002215 [Scheffersomyces spartinae]
MPEERATISQIPSTVGPSSASETATPPAPSQISKLKHKKSLFSLNSRSNSGSSISNTNNSSTSGFGKFRVRSHPQDRQRQHQTAVSTGLKTPVTPSVNTNTNSETSGTSSVGFFRRVSALFSKIRAISDEVFASDELLEELFSDSCSTSYTTKDTFTPETTTVELGNKTAKPPMYKLSSGSSSGRGTTTLNSKSAELESIIEDILKQYQRITPISGQDSERDDGIRTLVEVSDNGGPLLDIYDVDFNLLRDELIKRLGKDASDIDVGELIWEYRRNKWLTPTKKEQEIKSHLSENTLGPVAKDSYAKIYNHLVRKNSPLRKGKSINLPDLLAIVNAGWIVEEKYERAANGLP